MLCLLGLRQPYSHVVLKLSGRGHGDVPAAHPEMRARMIPAFVFLSRCKNCDQNRSPRRGGGGHTRAPYRPGSSWDSVCTGPGCKVFP
jgi:hypothetical protein